MSDSATAGYYGSGDLWCKVRSKVKAVETTQLQYLQEKEGQGCFLLDGCFEDLLLGKTVISGQRTDQEKTWG